MWRKIPGNIINRMFKGIFGVGSFFLFLIFTNSCVSEFVPDIKERKELIVVEGLVTDQPEPYIVKLSRSLPLDDRENAKPVSGCTVLVSDNLGNDYFFRESETGIYKSDPAVFKGETGRFYTLKILAGQSTGYLNYESSPMELKPVPSIDSLYYEKKILSPEEGFFKGINAAQVYLDTHDPENSCRFFRWEYEETWLIRLLFSVDNKKCWISEKSKGIDVKSTTSLNESRVIRHPVRYITNTTDRLLWKYSILVNQYSLNEDEYNYLERIREINENTGGLYDKVPADVPNNLRCMESPDINALGYFSVSAKSSGRIFILEKFEGIFNPYTYCIRDTIYGDMDPPGLNLTRWVLFDIPKGGFNPRTRILTDDYGCADCTVRGSNVRPPFWIGD